MGSQPRGVLLVRIVVEQPAFVNQIQLLTPQITLEGCHDVELLPVTKDGIASR